MKMRKGRRLCAAALAAVLTACFICAGSVRSVEAASSKTAVSDAKLAKQLDKVIKKSGVTKKTKNKEALKLLFDYTVENYEYMRDTSTSHKTGWQVTYAKKMLSKKKGSCYHYAALYAYLVRRATGLPVRVVEGTSNCFNASRWQPHAWTEVKISGTWYRFDTNAAKYSTRGKKWYKCKITSLKNMYKADKKTRIKE